MSRTIVAALAIIAVIAAAGLWWISRPPGGARPTVSAAMHGAGSDAPAPNAEDILVPDLTPVAMNGKQVFEKNCAACHGPNGAGTDQGPPLIHKIYEPGHHGDAAFHLAAKNGVQSHHWRYGNMPPVAGLTDTQVGWIVKYVREVQRANGIN